MVTSLLRKPSDRSVSPSRTRLCNKRLKRTLMLAFCIALFLAIFHIFQRWRSYEKPYTPMWPDVQQPYSMVTTSDFRPVSMSPHNRTMQELCKSFPHHLVQTIQPVLKTGFTDDPDRMPGQLDGPSACFRPGDLLIFSDASDNMAGHAVTDILGSLPDSYHSFAQFQPYLEQTRMRNNGTAKSNPEMLKAIDGWKLDKYKFLPAVEQAWLMKPNRDFYVFYESDTYVFWDSMFRFLKNKDPNVPLYMGSASPGRQDEKGLDTLFANGGPGYVLSRAAVKKLLHRETDITGHYIDPPFTEKWRHLLHDLECCGDSVLGYVLWKSGIEMQALYPMFTQHLFQSLPYDAMRWCSPVLTYHKPSPQQIRGLARWEYGARRNDHPLRHSDIWEFYRPGEEHKRENWANNDILSRKVDDVVISSRDECDAHCRSLPECMQWTWRGQTGSKECFISEGVMYYGEAKEESTSGWIVDRIHKWMQDHACDDTTWDGPSLTRTFIPG